MNYLFKILTIIFLFSFLFSKSRHLGSVIDIDLSFDKQYYVSAGDDGKIFYCDTQLHEILKTFKYVNNQKILQVTINHDNNYLAVAFNNGLIENEKLNELICNY